MSIAQKIWLYHANQSEGRSVNLSAIAKACKLRVATIWTYHHAKARWTADIWLQALFLLGAAEFIGDNIVIKIPEGITLDGPLATAFKQRRPRD